VPIDFAAVAARFGPQLALEAQRALVSQRAISLVLEKRRSAAVAVEQATRMFPIVRFYDEAVTMVVSSSQRGILAVTSPPPSFVDQLVRGGSDFVEGISRFVEPFTKGTKSGPIVRFVTSFDRALGEVVASVERFAKPTPEMFDPSRRSAGDLFGLAALGFRALAEASRKGGEIDTFVEQLRGTLAIVRGEEGGGGTVAGPAPEAPERSLVEQLDAAALEIVSGIVVVGALPELIRLLLEAAGIRIRVWILDEFQKIERSVLDFRASMLRKSTIGLVAWADKAIDVFDAIQQVLGANIAFMLRFWRRLGSDFGEGVRSFAIGIVDFFAGFLEFIRAVPKWLDVLTGFDLTELLRPVLGWAGGLVSVIPSIRIADVLDADARHVNADLADTLDSLISAEESDSELGRTLAWPWKQEFFDKVDFALAQAHELVDALFPGWGESGSHAIAIPAEAPPLVFTSNAPNIFDTLFGGGRATKVIGLVDKLQTSLDYGMGETLRRARDGVGKFATDFEKAAADAARLRVGARFDRVAAHSTTLADTVFGPEVRDAKKAVADRPPDALAQAFESWLATGGFVLIGEVIPAYVQEIARHWREQVEHGEELTAPLLPTSPRILRQRAALGRVEVPRLTLRAPGGRELDGGLADEGAFRFSNAVSDAYETGRKRLAELAALPGD
jgi:hypothetical protein